MGLRAPFFYLLIHEINSVRAFSFTCTVFESESEINFGN